MAISTATGQTRGASYMTGVGVFNAAVSALLKEFYIPGIRDQLYNKSPLRKKLKRGNAADYNGKYWVYALHTGRNTGTGYIAERGRLPDPGTQEHKQTKYSERQNYGRIKISGPSMVAHKNDRGSFARILDIEMNGLTRDIAFRDNAVLFGNGSGRLAQVNGAPAGATVTLDNPGGFFNTGLGTQYLEQGMRVASFTVATETAGVFGAPTFVDMGGGNRAGTISSINYATGTITLATPPATLADNCFLYTVSDVDTATPAGSTSRGHHPNGLAAIIDNEDPVFQDGAANNWPEGLGGVDSDTVPTWRANVFDNGGTAIPFAQDMFQQMIDITEQAGDGAIDDFWTTYGVRRQYLNSLVPNKRFAGGNVGADGHLGPLTYDGHAIMVDKMCTRGRIYGLDYNHIQYCTVQDYDWIDNDGAVLSRLQDEHAFQATLWSSWQLCTDMRNAHSLFTDIQDL